MARGRKPVERDRRKALPPGHALALAGGPIIAIDTSMMPGPGAIAAEIIHAQNLARARELLAQRRHEAEIEAMTRRHLNALRAAAQRYLEVQGRAGDERRTIAVRNGAPVYETIPGPAVRVSAALDVVEREVLSWGVHRFVEYADVDSATGETSTTIRDERVNLEWRERWTADVSTYLSSEDMANLLAEVDEDAARQRRRDRDKANRAAYRDGTRNAGKRAAKVRAKIFGAPRR